MVSVVSVVQPAASGRTAAAVSSCRRLTVMAFLSCAGVSKVSAAGDHRGGDSGRAGMSILGGAGVGVRSGAAEPSLMYSVISDPGIAAPDGDVPVAVPRAP